MSALHVAICTPSTGMVRTAYAHSLARLVMHYAQSRVFPEGGPQELSVYTIEGSGISGNRESLVVDALKAGATHICYIDEDMGFAPDTLHVLLRKRQAIVGANYPMRVPPMQFTALSMDAKTRVHTDATRDGLEPAYYIGFGFAVIQTKVFETLAKPWFLSGYNLTSERYTTEDHPFCKKAREAGFPVYVDHDASRRVWHVGYHNYRWQDVPAPQE